MKVIIKKTHPSWHILYPDSLQIGDEAELTGHTVTTKDGLKFSADDMCKCFSNNCSYADIFDKQL